MEYHTMGCVSNVLLPGLLLLFSNPTHSQLTDSVCALSFGASCDGNRKQELFKPEVGCDGGIDGSIVGGNARDVWTFYGEAQGAYFAIDFNDTYQLQWFRVMQPFWETEKNFKTILISFSDGSTLEASLTRSIGYYWDEFPGNPEHTSRYAHINVTEAYGSGTVTAGFVEIEMYRERPLTSSAPDITTSLRTEMSQTSQETTSTWQHVSTQASHVTTTYVSSSYPSSLAVSSSHPQNQDTTSPLSSALVSTSSPTTEEPTSIPEVTVDGTSQNPEVTVDGTSQNPEVTVDGTSQNIRTTLSSQSTTETGQSSSTIIPSSTTQALSDSTTDRTSHSSSARSRPTTDSTSHSSSARSRPTTESSLTGSTRGDVTQALNKPDSGASTGNGDGIDWTWIIIVIVVIVLVLQIILIIVVVYILKRQNRKNVRVGPDPDQQPEPSYSQWTNKNETLFLASEAEAPASSHSNWDQKDLYRSRKLEKPRTPKTPRSQRSELYNRPHEESSTMASTGDTPLSTTRDPKGSRADITDVSEDIVASPRTTPNGNTVLAKITTATNQASPIIPASDEAAGLPSGHTAGQVTPRTKLVRDKMALDSMLARYRLTSSSGNQSQATAMLDARPAATAANSEKLFSDGTPIVSSAPDTPHTYGEELDTTFDSVSMSEGSEYVSSTESSEFHVGRSDVNPILK